MSLVTNKCGSEFLEANFAPVGNEIDVAELEIEGSIPPALSGQYLRNGPNPMFEPLGSYHWFDGDGMIHAISLENGRASYRNRWIRSRGLDTEQRHGSAIYGGLAAPGLTDPRLVGEGGPVKNTANTNIIRHAGRILRLMEGCPPTEIDDELRTLGEHDFGGRLQGSFTAHPHIDPRNGEMMVFGYIPTLKYMRVSATGELLQIEDIEVPKPTMMHDFAVSRNHVVFFDSPAVLDLEAFLAGRPMVKWDPDNGTRVGVLPREGSGSDIRWFEIPNCYVVHFMNAWEEGNRIMVDGCRFAQMDFGAGDASIPDPESFLTRFTIDLDAGTVSEQRLGDLPGDFPRVRAEAVGEKYRYGVAATFVRTAPLGPRFDSVTLYDMVDGSELTHEYRDGEVTGEPVFAPDPSGTAENDGWIISMVSETGGSHSDLVILDANDMTETARVHMPRRVPFGFHGNWLPNGSDSMLTRPG